LFGDQHDYPTLITLAEQSDPGADGVMFLPYLSGELQPINDGNARGVFFGLSMSTAQPQIVRAVLEGTAFAIAHNVHIAEHIGGEITEIRAVGGPTRSALWCQIIADVTGRHVAVLDHDGGAPLGNTLLAAAGLGLIDDPATRAMHAARIEHIFPPRIDHHAYYRSRFTMYRQLYLQLKEQFAALAALPPWNIR
jgi:xylulokinase